MILIISELNDASTNDVINWLTYYKKSFVRINETDILNISEFNMDSNGINVEFEYESFGKALTFNLKEITSVWYRRGQVNLNFLRFSHKNKKIQEAINRNFFSEKIYIENFINKYLLSKRHVNSFLDNSTNKLYNLHLASSVGLIIPNTTITTQKVTVHEKINKHNSIITKAIIEGNIPINYTSSYGYNTNLIENVHLNEMPENFSRSLFQETLDKAYELRIFYLNNELYASAIFSQNDEQTKIDFRNYNFEKGNRVVPFKLPNDIKDKLLVFIDKLGINCGSIDMVVTKKLDFVFLEINPIGQFQQVSMPCNYYLEKQIVNQLN